MDIGLPHDLMSMSHDKIKDFRALSDAFGHSIVSYVFQAIGGNVSLAGNCSTQNMSKNARNDTQFLEMLLKRPGNLKLAPLVFIDASTKIPNGAFQGHFMWVGEYQECLETIKPIYNSLSNRYFKGKYFTGILKTNGTGFFASAQNPKGFPLIIGLCLPDSYSTADAECAIDIALNYVENIPPTQSIMKYLNLSVSAVYTDEDDPFDNGSIAALVISGIIVALVLLGTFVDILFPNIDSDLALLDGGKSLNVSSSNPAHESADYETTDRSGLLDQDMFGDSIQLQYGRCAVVKRRCLDVFKAFSFISNARKLLNTPTAKSPLSCVNGLRVISMWWVIQGHVYGFSSSFLDNIAEGYKITRRFTFQPIINGTFSVDTFFFLSGLLVAYLALKEVKEKGKLSWMYYFLHRFWRLTPLYAFVLMIYSTLVLYMFSGPYSHLVKPKDSELRKGIDVCKGYWWTNLIYINNYYPDYGSLDGTCMGWSWYLAIDMQCYIIISPAFIALLSNRNRLVRLVGIVYAILLVLICIGLRGFFVGYYGLNNFNTLPEKHKGDIWVEKGALYQRTYTRLSVYVVGLLTGHVCVATNCRIKMNKLLAFLCWCVCIASALAVVYGLYYYNHQEPKPAEMTPVASGFYISLSRTVWAMCLSWVVIACMSGYGGPINSILSWPIWAPLGRLTFGAYLVHPIIIFVYYTNLLTPLHFTDLTLIYLFIANLVVSYAVAFVVSMAVEAPMMQLEKLFVKRK